MVERVAVGTDGSDTAAKAVEFAIDLAAKHGAKLIVISSYVPVDEGRLRKEQAEAPQEVQWALNPMEDVEAAISEVEEKAKERGVPTFAEARQGDPADVLVSIAEEQNADVLVVGNKGMHRRVLGSVPNTVSHKAQCSVLIVKTVD